MVSGDILKIKIPKKDVAGGIRSLTLTPHPSPLAPRPSPLAPRPSPLAPRPSPLAPRPSPKFFVYLKIQVYTLDIFTKWYIIHCRHPFRCPSPDPSPSSPYPWQAVCRSKRQTHLRLQRTPWPPRTRRGASEGTSRGSNCRIPQALYLIPVVDILIFVVIYLFCSPPTLFLPPSPPLPSSLLPPLLSPPPSPPRPPPLFPSLDTCCSSCGRSR